MTIDDIGTLADAQQLSALEARLQVHFTDHEILLRSLAHRSWCAENGEPESNERLEFLGDSVLGLVVTHYVFEHFPSLPEGQLSEVRAGVVNSRVLAEVAMELDLGAHLLLGKGEDAAGGRAKQSILADAFEAVIAAVYLDQGFAVARDVVLCRLQDRIAEAAAGPGGRDYKTRLQEITAARVLGRPRYVVRDEGPDHAKHFFATVYVSDRPYGEGEGRSKKQAEQAAAWVAWTRLQEETTAERPDGSEAWSRPGMKETTAERPDGSEAWSRPGMKETTAERPDGSEAWSRPGMNQAGDEGDDNAGAA